MSVQFVSSSSWHRCFARLQKRSDRHARLGTSFVLLALACASCEDDPTEPPPRWTPAAADLRFKRVGSTTTALPSLISALGDFTLVHHNRFGTPLEISPCAPPSDGGTNCSWLYAAFDVPDVNTIYYGIGSLPKLDADLDARQRWTFATPGLDEDINGVVTSLIIDEPGSAYATSAIQTTQMREFDLAWATVPPSALQAAASQAGADGRVITALALNAGTVAYLSYGWQRDQSTVYEVKVVQATVETLAREAASLAGAGYIITAFGGNYSDGLLIVGTRARGMSTPRPLAVATDAIRTQPYDPPAAQLARAGYAIVGSIFVDQRGATPAFSVYLGEK